jgi:hypothetical protein
MAEMGCMDVRDRRRRPLDVRSMPLADSPCARLCRASLHSALQMRWFRAMSVPLGARTDRSR